MKYSSFWLFLVLFAFSTVVPAADLAAEREALLAQESTLREKLASTVSKEKVDALRALADAGDTEGTNAALTEIEKSYLEYYQYDRKYIRYFSEVLLSLGNQVQTTLDKSGTSLDEKTKVTLVEKNRVLKDSYDRLQEALAAPWENFIESKRNRTFEGMVKTIDEMAATLNAKVNPKKPGILSNLAAKLKGAIADYWQERVWPKLEPRFLNLIRQNDRKSLDRMVRLLDKTATLAMGVKGIKYKVEGSIEKFQEQYKAEPNTLFVLMGIGHGSNLESFSSTAVLMKHLQKNGIHSAIATGAYYFMPERYADALTHNPNAVVVAGKPKERNPDGTVKTFETSDPIAPIQHAVDADNRALIVWVEGTDALQAGGGITQLPPQSNELVRLLSIKAKRNLKNGEGFNKVVVVPIAVNQTNTGGLTQNKEGVSAKRLLDFGRATTQINVGEPLSAEAVNALTSFKSTQPKGESPGGANLFAWANAMAVYSKTAPLRLVGRDPLVNTEEQLTKHFSNLCKVLEKIGRTE